MVDVMPWGGDYSGTVVRNNTIIGGHLRSSTPSDGDIVNDVIVKLVIFLVSITTTDRYVGSA
jgi:hypothetical protein